MGKLNNIVTNYTMNGYDCQSVLNKPYDEYKGIIMYTHHISVEEYEDKYFYYTGYIFIPTTSSLYDKGIEYFRRLIDDVVGEVNFYKKYEDDSHPMIIGWDHAHLYDRLSEYNLSYVEKELELATKILKENEENGN